MRDSTLLRAFCETPWAMLPEKLAEIREVVRLHALGAQLPPEGFVAASRPSASRAGAVQVLPVYGVISQRMGMLTQMSGGTSTEKLTGQIRQAVADPGVKAIVLDVDSPGGSVAGVTELAAEIRAAREQKHIVAVANSLAASAAYWLASQASEVWVTPSGQVGSIGVYTEHVDMSEALAAGGMKPTIVRAGKYKAEGNPYEPLTEEALAALQSQVDDYYVMFVGDVAAGRGKSRAAVRGGFGEGRLVGAQAAVKEGMADKVGTLDQVLAKLGAGRAAPSSMGAEDTAPEIVAAVEAPDDASARRRWLELESLRHG